MATTEIAERTEEQKIAIAARKEYLREAAASEAAGKRARAQRRVMDPVGTIRMLLEKKLITKAWAKRNAGNNKMIANACIAKMVDCVSMTGHAYNLNPVTGFRKIR